MTRECVDYALDYSFFCNPHSFHLRSLCGRLGIVRDKYLYELGMVLVQVVTSEEVCELSHPW